jgi:hypothetical protein
VSSKPTSTGVAGVEMLRIYRPPYPAAMQARASDTVKVQRSIRFQNQQAIVLDSS